MIPRHFSSADVIDRTGVTPRQLELWRRRFGLGVADGPGSWASYSWREMLAVACVAGMNLAKGEGQPLVLQVRANVVDAVVTAVLPRRFLLVRPDRWMWAAGEQAMARVAMSLDPPGWWLFQVDRIAAQVAAGSPR